MIHKRHNNHRVTNDGSLSVVKYPKDHGAAKKTYYEIQRKQQLAFKITLELQKKSNNTKNPINVNAIKVYKNALQNYILPLQFFLLKLRKLLIDRCRSNTMANQKISVRLEEVDNIRDCFRQ